MYVWIILKANRQNTQRNEPHKALNFLKLHNDIWNFFMYIFLIKKGTLSPLLMIFHVMGMFICIRNLKQ